MKTKIKLLYIGVISLITGLNSCSLDEYNPSGTNKDIISSTEKGFLTIVNSSYYNWGAQFYGREDIMFLGEGGTDLWYMGQRGTYADQLMAYNKLAASTGQIRNTWLRLYEIVNYCNMGLDRIENVEFADPITKENKEGELRFNRAYAYWMICEFWGDATLRLHETTGFEEYAYRSSRKDFYDLIITDLERAKKILPITQSEIGRADMKAAYGLLARTALTRASYLEYFENNMTEAEKYYKIAYDAAEYLIENRVSLGCDLYSSYEEVFDPANNKVNKEAVWTVTHSTLTNLNPQNKNPNRLFMWYNPKYTSLCGMPGVEVLEYGRDNNNRMMPTKYLLNLFNEDIDSRYYASFREAYVIPIKDANGKTVKTYTWEENDAKIFGKDFATFINKVEINPGDTALFYTKKAVADKLTRRYGVKDINDLYNPDGTISTETNNNRYYPALTKFRDPDRLANSQVGTKNVIVMRLSEIYLISAEAAFKLDDKAKAKERINDIRRRAAVKTPVDKTNDMLIEESDLSLDFILDERARELCGEHLRWFDLKRTKQLEHRLGVGKQNPDITEFDLKKHYVRPIPQTELDGMRNKDEYGQNPYY